MSASYLLKGGTVYDGAPSGGLRADLRMVDGTIAEVGPNLSSEGSAVIDADGLWVLPGFVDAHSHADAAVLTGDGMELRALAGVTTEIVGQDGLGLSFASGAARDIIGGVIRPLVVSFPDEEFTDTADYLAAVDRGSFARVATLVPHGSVRASVVGPALRAATPDELATMRRLSTEGVAQGAAGFSTGLSYPPALASDTDELATITAGLPAGTPYVTHLRDYGATFDAAIDEAIEICERSKLSLHLSHFHVSGPGRDGRTTDYLERIATSGRDVSWDSYPYTSGCTFIRALLPPTAQGMPLADILGSLDDPQTVARLAHEIDARGPGPTFAGGWDVIYLTGLRTTALSSWDARTIAEIAAAHGSSPADVALRALEASSGNACVIVDHGHRANVQAIATANGHHVGSDGILGSGVPHPRAGNTFWRFLAWAKRGEIDVSVGTMVSRMTGSTASRFGLHTGRLRAGYPADVLLVDPSRIDDGPELGTAVPNALVSSFIAGERVVADGVWRGSRIPGLALRSEWSHSSRARYGESRYRRSQPERGTERNRNR